jgi:hypothetical protein
MKNMSNVSNLQVIFSKRHSGLFEKACMIALFVMLLSLYFNQVRKCFSLVTKMLMRLLDRYLLQVLLQNTIGVTMSLN